MAYSKNTWASGDVVTSAKLNNMENGIEAANSGSLPAVTSDDNGDVLTVVEGAWAKAAPAVFLVPSTTENDGTVMTLTKTWQEIADAMHSGLIAVVMSDLLADEYFIQQDMVWSVQRQIAESGPPVVYRYDVIIGAGDDQTTLSSNTADGYPSITFE